MKKIYKRRIASLMTLCFVCMAFALTATLETDPDYTNIIDIFSYQEANSN